MCFKVSLSFLPRSEHRLQVMDKILGYVRDVKRSQIIEIMHNELFDKVFASLAIEILRKCVMHRRTM